MALPGFSSLTRMGGQVNMAQSLVKGDRKSAAGFAQAALQLTILFALFRYCSQYGLYRSSAEVLYPDRCRKPTTAPEFTCASPAD